MSDQDTAQLDRYLLGRLSQDESEALEARLLSDGRLFELAEAAEDDLVDRYVRGELAARDAKRFERHLLPSPRIRERVATARALTSWADGRAAGRRTAAPRPASVPARLAWAAALVAAIAAGALGFEVSRLHDRLDEAATVAAVEAPPAAATEIGDRTGTEAVPEPPATPAEEPEPAAESAAEIERLAGELSAARERIATLESAAEPPAAAPPGAEPATATLFLTLITRSGGAERTLELDGAERAELQLELGRRRPSGPVRATVWRGNAVIWDEADVEVVTEAGESMARLVLPRESLVPGHYRLELFEEGGDGASDRLAAYTFSVKS